MNRYSYVLNNPLKYTDPSGYQKYYMFDLYATNYDFNLGMRKGGGGIVSWGYDFGLPGGENGTGWNGYYYDWSTDTYRSTDNYSAVPWQMVYNDISNELQNNPGRYGDTYSGATAVGAYSAIRNGKSYFWRNLNSIGMDGTINVTSEKVFLNPSGVGFNAGGVNVYVETDGIGHVYAEVNGTVFSYGRYDGSYSPSSGRFGPIGPGIMMRYKGKEAKEFIKERTAKYPTSVYNITDVNAKVAFDYWNNLYWSGTPTEQGGRHVDMYILLGLPNNCATMIGSGLQEGGFFLRSYHTPMEMNYWLNWYNK